RRDEKATKKFATRTGFGENSRKARALPPRPASALPGPGRGGRSGAAASGPSPVTAATREIAAAGAPGQQTFAAPPRGELLRTMAATASSRWSSVLPRTGASRGQVRG